MGESEQTRAQTEGRDGKPQGQTSRPPVFCRKGLMPPSVVAPMRNLARDFLALTTRNQLLLVAVANGNTPTESGDLIAAAVAEIETTLAKPDAEREADLAAVAADARRRLAPFASILAQIDPTRRATVEAYTDGRVRFTPADAATARSTPCRHVGQKILKRGFNCRKYERGEIVVGPPPCGKPKPHDHHVAHGVQGCHNCRRGTGEWCIGCKRVNRDDIRIERTPHNVRPGLAAEPFAPSDAGGEPGRATRLAPRLEDTLRLFLATFAAMPPLGILHVVHKATRRTDTVADFLRQFVATMALADIEKASRAWHRYGRATILTAWNAMVAKNPDWAVFQTWNGHGRGRGDGAKKRKSCRGAEANEAAAALDGRTAADFDDAPGADRAFDRREPFAADRDDETTDYFFDDGSGAEL